MLIMMQFDTMAGASYGGSVGTRVAFKSVWPDFYAHSTSLDSAFVIAPSTLARVRPGSYTALCSVGGLSTFVYIRV